MLTLPSAALVFFLFCFLYSYGALRHLHSFPTRRSSDLGLAPANVDHGFDNAYVQSWNLNAQREVMRGLGVTVRSEEHTSELQSLRHLVCRLLLEKKNETRLHVRRCSRPRRSTVASGAAC